MSSLQKIIQHQVGVKSSLYANELEHQIVKLIIQIVVKNITLINED